MAGSIAGLDPIDFVRIVYEGVLRRSPDDPGLQHAVFAIQHGMAPENFIAEVIASDEFRTAQLNDHGAVNERKYDPAKDPLLNSVTTQDVAAANARLSTYDALDPVFFREKLRDAFDQFHEEMPSFGGQDDYVGQHQQRFFELANIVFKLIPKHSVIPASILDVGWSVNTLAMSKIFSNHNVFVMDRPGMPVPPSLQPRSIIQDLTVKDLHGVDLGARFDLIIIAEVIEHLLSNPIKVLSFLLQHLRPEGRLIITTPNFFRFEAVQAFDRRDNPQPIYPYESGPEDAPHFHVREYGMREVLHFAVEAGGSIDSYFYSACWDDLTLTKHMDSNEWANMVVIVRRAGEP